jgi:hypothetical protein
MPKKGRACGAESKLPTSKPRRMRTFPLPPGSNWSQIGVNRLSTEAATSVLPFRWRGSLRRLIPLIRMFSGARWLGTCSQKTHALKSCQRCLASKLTFPDAVRDPADPSQHAEVPTLFGADCETSKRHRFHDSEAPVVTRHKRPHTDRARWSLIRTCLPEMPTVSLRPPNPIEQQSHRAASVV